MQEGVQTGGPPIPLIFIIVANRFHHMIVKCWEKGLIKSLGCRNNTNAVINFHYTDGTLILRKECLVQANGPTIDNILLREMLRT